MSVSLSVLVLGLTSLSHEHVLDKIFQLQPINLSLCFSSKLGGH